MTEIASVLKITASGTVRDKDGNIVDRTAEVAAAQAEKEGTS